MKTLVKMKFGSHLYGTNSAESDTDYKGIFLPSIEDCILNKIPKTIDKSTGNDKSKNNSSDIDEEYYSLQYFMKLASKGEMIVIDMLHAPEDMIIESSKEWECIQECRELFYTKNLKGYVGYVRKQVAKYGCKGSRLAALEGIMNIIKHLKSINKTEDVGQSRLSAMWNLLPEGDYIQKGTESSGTGGRIYEICGKKMQETATIQYFYDMIKRLYDSFGDRAQQAKENKGIDWKAVSHAFRACDQLIEIYETGDLVYPLKNAEEIKAIKYGKMHFIDDKLDEKLENKLNLVEKLSKESNYPGEFNQKPWDEWIIKECYNV